jgi:glutamate-1-semialdehyde 2,1-aminomutase
VDESLIVTVPSQGPDGAGAPRAGNVGAPVDVRETSRVAEYNDLDGLDRQLARSDLDLVDMGGVGGTLAGNPLSVTAVCATLREVLRDEVFGEMSALAERFAAGGDGVISRHGLPWSVTRLGARAEYRFTSPALRTGTEAAAASGPGLDDYLHTYLANRGILLTPFHNMALMCPATRPDDVNRHTEIFGAAVAELLGA